MPKHQTLVVCALAAFAATLAPAQDALSVCDAANNEARFAPACFVRIFEDDGSGRRLLLYAPENKHFQSLLLKADSESKLIIDVSRTLEGDGDAGLNNVFIRATMRKGNSTKQIPVVGYSEIGEKEGDKISQAAFDFQTFTNIAAKITNLYFISKDLIEYTYGDQADQCKALLKTGGEGVAKDKRADCDFKPTEKTEKLDKFGKRFQLLTPEVSSLATFFASGANRTVTAELANRIFEIDIESLEAIAKQLAEKRTLLASGNVKKPEDVFDDVLERTKQTYSSLSSVIGFVGVAADAFEKKNDAALKGMCGKALAEARKALSANKWEFARNCYAEHQLPRYKEALKRYLTPGLIDLANNDAAAGDVIILAVETKGKSADQPGIKSEWRVRVSNYGWKAGVDGSLLFLRRIGVDERHPSLRPARFAPFPGFTLNATYFGQHPKATISERNAPLPSSYYRELEPDGNSSGSMGRILQPSIGANVTFMTFGSRDFNPVTNQFNSVNGSNFELGAGPLVGLFGNRLSVTFGWNLMQPSKRMYWGLGFGFVSFAKDLGGLLKKN